MSYEGPYEVRLRYDEAPDSPQMVGTVPRAEDVDSWFTQLVRSVEGNDIHWNFNVQMELAAPGAEAPIRVWRLGFIEVEPVRKVVTL